MLLGREPGVSVGEQFLHEHPSPLDYVSAGAVAQIERANVQTNLCPTY
ncbi:hypothetical protein ABZY81_39315 [Streptomyces sp. NPDC006514]